MSFLSDGSQWLASKLKSQAAASITYRRGNSRARLCATLGRAPIGISGRQGAKLQVRYAERDFLFAASDLILGGVLTKPQRGDTVEWEDETYVVTPNDSGVFWQQIVGSVMIRVHTKRV